LSYQTDKLTTNGESVKVKWFYMLVDLVALKIGLLLLVILLNLKLVRLKCHVSIMFKVYNECAYP